MNSIREPSLWLLPVLDRMSCIDFKMPVPDQHKVLEGKGKAVLDDSIVIEVKDMMWFTEKT